MQNQGYSRNNLHQGNVRITQDLQVDGKFEINDLNVNTLTIGDPEYTLPTQKATNAGDIIVATGDGSTSQWQPLSQGVGKIWSNLYNQYTPRDTFSNKVDWQTLDVQGFGTKAVPNPDVYFDAGSAVRITCRGIYRYFKNNASDKVQGAFRIKFGTIETEIWDVIYLDTNAPTTPPSLVYVGGLWELQILITNFASPYNLKIGSTAFTTSTTNGLPAIPNNPVADVSVGIGPWNTIQDGTTYPITDNINSWDGKVPIPIEVEWLDRSNGTSGLLPRANMYTIDLISDVGVYASSETLTTDHLLLSNLNGGTLGDGGHINLFDKRGIKPMTGNIDMSSNNIINAKDITDSFGNKIDMNTGGFLSTLELSSADEIKLLNTTNNNFMTMSNAGTNITSLTGSLNINHALGGNTINMYNTTLFNALTLISNTAGVYMEEKSSTNNLAVAAAGIVANSNSGNLTIRNSDVSGKIELVKNGGGLIEFSSPSGVEAVVDSKVVKVNNGLYINGDKIIYVPDGAMPSSFSSNTTYIFCGSRTTATTINLSTYDNITFKGESRETSSIEFTGVGVPFITTTDANFSLVDLKLKCNVASSSLLVGSNALKDKILTIQNCEVRESYAFADISGYELVDVNNVIFIHLRGDGILTNQKCLYLNGVAKTNITSCELVKFFEFGQPANTNPFDGAMIYFIGACGAININNCIIHPRVNQRGVEIEASTTFLEFCLNSNAFINVGLTTGTILQTNSNVAWDTNAISEANSLLPNLKSYVGAQLSALNTATTATSATPADINLNNLLVPFGGFGVTVGTGGGVTYNRKRPVNFQVTFVANLQAITGGAGQRVALTVSKNGVNTGINSFVTLDSAGTEPKSVTLTLVGSAVQGDVFRSQLVNLSTSSNVTCLDLIVSGVEI